MAALTDMGREISASLDLPTVLARISTRARELLVVDSSAISCWSPTARPCTPIPCGGRGRRHPRNSLAFGRGPHRPDHPGRRARNHPRLGQRPARHEYRGYRAGGPGADDAGPAPGRRPHDRRMVVWRSRSRRCSASPTSTSSPAWRARRPSPSRTPGCTSRPSAAPAKRRPGRDRPRDLGHARPEPGAGAHRPVRPPSACRRHQRRVPAGARRANAARAGGARRHRGSSARQPGDAGPGHHRHHRPAGQGAYINNTARDPRASTSPAPPKTTRARS